MAETGKIEWTDTSAAREIAAKLSAAQKRLVMLSESDDLTGEEGCGVDISGTQYRTARSLRALGIGNYTHGSFIADMYWNNAAGLAVRAILEGRE